MLNPATSPRHRRQAGLSLVELMVGLAVGLIVVAAATLLMSSQLSENRRLLLETQLQQDLRATADIMSREMRRADAMNQSDILQTLWSPDVPSSDTNPYAAYFAPATNKVTFRNTFTDDPSVSHVESGFWLDGNVLRMRVPAGPGSFQWQPLTDPAVMNVTAFRVTLATDSSASIRMPCPKLCSPGNDTSCWPTIEVRELRYSIEAQATSNASVKRAVNGAVRVRTDRVTFADSSDPADQHICPP